MNYKLSITLAAALALIGCQQESEQAAQTTSEKPAAAPAAPVLTSGIDRSGFDESVRPQDDFFEYVNGGWVKTVEMPKDRARWGTFDALRDQAQKDVRDLVKEVSGEADVADGSPTQKIRDYYNAYMDADKATELGASAIQADLDRIQAASSLDDVYRLFGSLSIYGVTEPIGSGIFSDLKDPDTNVVYIGQAGLTLPDRDYYLKDDDQFVKGRKLYLDYVTNVFKQSGIADGADRAERLLALEAARIRRARTKHLVLEVED